MRIISSQSDCTYVLLNMIGSRVCGLLRTHQPNDAKNRKVHPIIKIELWLEIALWHHCRSLWHVARYTHLLSLATALSSCAQSSKFFGSRKDISHQAKWLGSQNVHRNENGPVATVANNVSTTAYFVKIARRGTTRNARSWRPIIWHVYTKFLKTTCVFRAHNMTVISTL